MGTSAERLTQEQTLRNKVVSLAEKFAVFVPRESDAQKEDALGPPSFTISESTMAPVNGPITKSLALKLCMASFVTRVIVKVFGLLKKGLLCPTMRRVNQGSQIVEELDELDELDEELDDEPAREMVNFDSWSDDL